MKRSRPLRADPDKTRAWKERSRTPLRQRPRERQRDAMSRRVCAMVRQREQGLCACGCRRPIAPFPLGYHHVLPKSDGMWPELVNHEDNIVGLAADCHANHEAGTTRIPRSAIWRAEHLATTGRAQGYLERTYGPLPGKTAFSPSDPPASAVESRNPKPRR